MSQCKAKTIYGTQCKNNTNKGPLCWVHARKQYKVHVNDSRARNADLGLYAYDGKKDDAIVFKKDQYIVPYLGRHTSLTPSDPYKKFAYKINDRHYISGTNPNSSYARYVVDRPKRYNSEFITDDRKHVVVKATKNIRNNKEIYAQRNI